MSNNYNPTDFTPGEHGYGNAGFWPDNQYASFDADFTTQNGDAPGIYDQNASQDWGYAPDSFSLADGPDHPDNPYGWTGNGNNVEPNYLSNETSGETFSNNYQTSASISNNDHHRTAARTSQNNTASTSAAPSVGHGQSIKSDFPASPYAFNNGTPANQPAQVGAIAPHALQLSDPAKGPGSREATPSIRSGSVTRDHLFRPIPVGKAYGNFSITTLEDLNEMTSSKQLGLFVNVANQPQNVAFNRSVVPAYVPRKSRNQLMKLLANDSGLKAKVDKKLSKKLAKQALPVAGTNAARIDAAKRRPDQSPQDSSEDDSSDDDSEEETMQAPIPAKRPTDSALEATKYDTIKSLWRVPYRSVTAEDIKKAMQDFWDIVQTIRDRWKSDLTAVKQAEEAKKVKEVPMLKDRVGSQRSMLQACLQAAVQHGHPDVLEYFGQHLPLMGALAIFIQDRVKEADYNGKLTTAILEFLSKCKSMTTGVLEKTQIAKLFLRLAKRGEDPIKILVKRINDSAAAATRKKKEEDSKSTAASKTSKLVKVATADEKKPASPTAGAKRRADGDGKQPLKRLAGSTSNDQAAKRAPSIDTKATGAANNQTTRKVATKPSSLFSGLTAYKKPVAAPATSTAAKSSAVTSLLGNVAATAPAAAQPKSGFSFADAMASLTQPKPVEREVKKEGSMPPETQEERAKRLRKEARRKLHVSFKIGEELTEVRYFEHDPDEELGHDHNQVRDANDRQSEGQMFKLQHKIDPDAMDIDDDDKEGDVTAEEIESEYRLPPEIDFSDLPMEEDGVQNYRRYGEGEAKAESPENEEQVKREASVLVAVYSTRSEIPSTPKEAPDEADTPSNPNSFGELPEEVKQALAKYEAAEQARLAQQPKIPYLANISALLGQLQQQPPQPPPQAQQSSDLDIQAILARIQGQQPPQQQQQAWQQPQQQQQYYGQQNYPYQPQPQWGGYNQQQQQQQQPQSPMTQPPQQPTPDLTAILASLQQSGAINIPAQTQTPGVPSMGGGMPMMGIPNMGNMGSGVNNDAGPMENDERRRMREGTSEGQTVLPKPGAPNYRVVPCKYWLEGKCQKGDNCTFKHEL